MVVIKHKKVRNMTQGILKLWLDMHNLTEINKAQGHL